ncbi:GNAT family N-acetyltransferase [Aquibacillus rhizosphaerae]
MVRFSCKDKNIYFYRLSVIPEKQGQGMAKRLLKALELYGLEHGCNTLTCKVRKYATKNIKLYHLIGYDIYDEEIIQRSNDIIIDVVSMKKTL